MNVVFFYPFTLTSKAISQSAQTDGCEEVNSESSVSCVFTWEETGKHILKSEEERERNERGVSQE